MEKNMSGAESREKVEYAIVAVLSILMYLILMWILTGNGLFPIIPITAMRFRQSPGVREGWIWDRITAFWSLHSTRESIMCPFPRSPPICCCLLHFLGKQHAGFPSPLDGRCGYRSLSL